MQKKYCVENLIDRNWKDCARQRLFLNNMGKGNRWLGQEELLTLF